MPEITRYRLTGQVSRRDEPAAARLRAEVWDRDAKLDRPLASARVDERGRFGVAFTSENLPVGARRTGPRITVRIYDGDELLESSVPSLSWKTDERGTSGRAQIDVVKPVDFKKVDFQIGSLEELKRHEAQVLQAIRDNRNGGLLFVLDPLSFLDDVGFNLAPGVRQELHRKFPKMARQAQPARYRALKNSNVQQEVQVNFQALFDEADL